MAVFGPRNGCKLFKILNPILKPILKNGLSTTSSPIHLATSHAPSRMKHFGKRSLQDSILITTSKFRDKVAITDKEGEFLYEDIYRRSYELSKEIEKIHYKKLKKSLKIAFLCPNDMSFVLSLWAIWLSGNIAIPLSKETDSFTLEKILKENHCDLVLTTKDQVNKIKKLSKGIILLDSSWKKNPVKYFDEKKPLPNFFNYTFNDNCLVLYSAGVSLGRPRGILLTENHLNARLNSAIKNWRLDSSDNILHALPLDTNYSLINSLVAPLMVGSKVVLLNDPTTTHIWFNLVGSSYGSLGYVPKISVFPSSPAMYVGLINTHTKLFKDRELKNYVKNSCAKKIRLMTSGMTSIPKPVRDKWKSLTGHNITEVYSSVELGMVLCEPLRASQLIQKKQDSSEHQSGVPVKGTQTRIVKFIDDAKTKYDILAEFPNGLKKSENQIIIGELLVKSPAASQNFLIQEDGNGSQLEDGWIITGDVVSIQGNCHSIMGRIAVGSLTLSSGISIKTSDVERLISKHESVLDVCVVGLKDPINSFKDSIVELAAIVVLDTSQKSVKNLKDWCNLNLPADQIPSVFKVTPRIELTKCGRVDKLKLASKVFENMPLIYLNDSKL